MAFGRSDFRPGPRRRLAAAWLLALACAAAACGLPARPHDALGAGAEPLRAHFNRDHGRVRVVILAAPT
jgi:hypothetical protein